MSSLESEPKAPQGNSDENEKLDISGIEVEYIIPKPKEQAPADTKEVMELDLAEAEALLDAAQNTPEQPLEPFRTEHKPTTNYEFDADTATIADIDDGMIRKMKEPTKDRGVQLDMERENKPKENKGQSWGKAA